MRDNGDTRGFLVVAWLIACGGGSGGAVPDSSVAQPVGRRCDSTAAEGDPTAIATPSLDCVTRTCLHVQDQIDDLCTAECVTAADCAAVPESACSEFACTPVVSIGPFACRSFCVCASQVPAGGLPISCP